MPNHVREYTNALLDFERIAWCIIERIRDGDMLSQDLLDSLGGVLSSRQHAEAMHEIINLVTGTIPLIPFNKEPS